jgi:exonuclease III
MSSQNTPDTPTDDQGSTSDGSDTEAYGHSTHRTHATTPNLFVGDELDPNKQQGLTRIYFQNLNGLKWDRDGGMWPMICQAMSGIHADIIGFAETNQDTTKYEVRHKLETIARKYFDHKKLIYGTSTRPARKTYKPGGTMMMTVMDSTSLVTETTRDRMGRWVATRYQGSSPQKVTVIIAYQVCQTQRTGINTAASQQISMILEESIAAGLTTRLNPREAFTHDLISFVQKRQIEGDHVLIIGDFNETVDDINSGTRQIIDACGLIDLCGRKLGNITHPSTYKRGTRRLDYALSTPDISNAVHNLGYDPFDYRGITSDHRGLYIDIDFDSILGVTASPLAPSQKRDFIADNPNAVTKYIQTKYKELKNHNITARLQELEQLTAPNHELAEKIDRDMVRASKIAAKAAKQRYHSPWSPALARAWATIHLLKAIRSQLKNPQIENWPTIRSWQKRYPGLPQDFPTTIEETERRLQEAKTTLRSIRQRADEHRQSHLDNRAAVYAALEQVGKEKIVQRMKRAEALKQCYKKLQFIRQEMNTAGINEVQVPRDPAIDPKTCPPQQEHWRTVKIPEEINNLLISRNRKHFGQAQGTPLTEPAFLAEVKYDGTGTTSEMILSGT